MLSGHYAPRKPLILGQIPELLEEYGSEKVGILSLTDIFHQIEDQYQIQLSLTGDLAEAAQNLFGSLRKLDAMPITYILAELVPNYGLGLAINDRLQRAAS
jgi:L-threonylcarbamoyladenylate synthase